jgi:hypothetical protein
MLVEGTCANGHELVCVVHDGRVTGVRAHGRTRDVCPECGARPYVVMESGIIPASTKLPSERPASEDPASHVRTKEEGPAPAAAAGDHSTPGRSTR